MISTCLDRVLLALVLCMGGLACSGGGGGGGAAGSSNLTQLAGKDMGQVVANIGGTIASAAPVLPTSASIQGSWDVQPLSIGFSGFTNDGAGTWTGPTLNDGTVKLRFYNSSNTLVATTSDSASFSSVTQVRVFLSVSKTFTGGYTLQAEAESSLASYDPQNPHDFPNTLSFTLTSGSGSKLSGEFGDLLLDTLSFSSNPLGRVLGNGTVEVSGTVKTDSGDRAMNANVSFNNGGTTAATLRSGVTVGAGAQFGSAAMDLQGLVFSHDGAEHVLERGTATESGTACSLSHINFEKYGSLSMGGSLASAGQAIGCSHRYESIDGTNSTVRWVLSGAEGVYIQGVFNTSGALSDISIVGIFSETGQPRCSHAPTWPNCYGDP